MMSIVYRRHALSKYVVASIRTRKSRHLSTRSWNNIIKEAEITVGYSTSFLNLRWLLTDEIANLATHIKRLIESNHPIIETGKHILTKTNQPSWGLIVLLVAKACGVNARTAECEKDVITGILHTQRMIAEVTEIFRSGIFFHKSLQLIEGMNESLSEMQYGNKIALLVGDYLITKSYEILAGINNSEIEEIMCSAIRDITEGNFFGVRNGENEPIPSPKYLMENDLPLFIDQFSPRPFDTKECIGKPKAEWASRIILGDGSLLGKGCMCAVKLGGHTDCLQKKGFSLGVNLASTNLAKQELNFFSQNSPAKVNRVSAPVLFHLQQNPTITIDDMNDISLKQIIRVGPGIRMTEEFVEELRQRTLDCLKTFPDNEAKFKLREIIMCI